MNEAVAPKPLMDAAPEEELRELLALAVADGLRLLGALEGTPARRVALETCQHLEHLLQLTPAGHRPLLELAGEELAAACARLDAGDLPAARRLAASAAARLEHGPRPG